MNIILEGPDNCGKSTLAQAISLATGWPIKEKEGRPKTWLAMLEKFRKYEAIDNHIIDRHPIVSQSVYGILRGDPEIPTDVLDHFFSRNDLIIYCRCLRSLEDHEASPTDTAAHLEMIDKQANEILQIYDNWGAMCADIVYTQYAKLPRVVAMVKAVLAHERG